MKSGLWTVVLVLVALIALDGAYIDFTEGGYVTITTVSANITYPGGATSGFLGPAFQVLSSTRVTGRGGGTGTDVIFALGNNDSVPASHVILSISSSTPGLTVTSVSPGLPLSLNPGSNETFDLTLTSSSSYNGVLTLLITTD